MTETKRLPVKVPLHTTPMGFWSSLRAARRNVLSIIPEIAVKQPIVTGKTGIRWHMIMEPTALKRVLLDALDDYPKSLVTKNLLRPAIGESLFIAEGAHWRWQRRTAAPVFSHRNVMNLTPVMTAAATRAADRIAQGGAQAFNALDEMVTTTFDVISDVTFSGDEGFDRSAVHNAINAYIADAGKISLLDMIGAPSWIPRPGRVFSVGAVKDMRRIADDAITARASRPKSEVPDLLDLLLAGEDPKTQRRMTTPELRDNLLTFIVAGHETTALALSWALYLLAFDPEAQDKARQEVQNVVKNGAATGDDIANLPFIRHVLDETQRLYPPAAIVSRTALRKDQLCGRDIMPGDTVMIPIYALHRHEMLWQEPDAFRPERWENAKPERYTYLPFIDGPRVCIGASFAIQEAIIVLATLLARFKFTLVEGKEPEPVMILTLRPENGVWLQAEPV